MAKAKVSTEDLIEQIEGMSVLELANLVKELEEKFGVSAPAMAAPMMVAGAGAGAAEAEEKTAFDVVLTSFGEKKINVIKAVREVNANGTFPATVTIPRTSSSSGEASASKMPMASS